MTTHLRKLMFLDADSDLYGVHHRHSFRGIWSPEDLRVIDEMIRPADSSQNLNLRLNVSDATDELLELRLPSTGWTIEKAYEKQNQFVTDASHD